MGVQTNVYLRLHVKQVSYSHVGVALAVTITLCEELVLSPGHVDPVGPSFSLVIYGGVRCRVSVVDELGLERRERKRRVRKYLIIKQDAYQKTRRRTKEEKTGS